jgi:putative DNA primase/helicase
MIIPQENGTVTAINGDAQTSPQHAATHDQANLTGHHPNGNATSNGHHAAFDLLHTELKLLAIAKHHPHVTKALHKRGLLPSHCLDPAAGCALSAHYAALNELGALGPHDVPKLLELWSRRNDEDAPLAVQALHLLDSLEPVADVNRKNAKEKALQLTEAIMPRLPSKNGTAPIGAGIEPQEKITLNLGFPLDDAGNGQRFASQHGHGVRYCFAWGSWLVYDACRWIRDEKAEVERLAKITARLIINEAQACDDDVERAALLKHAAASIKRSKREVMLKDAISEPGIAITTDELDANPWLLNCANCTLDLRTGERGPHDRADLLTKRIPVAYDPLAQCPTFLAFLDAIMAHRPNLIEFLQRAIGYSLTGDIREQVFFILHGSGANGKSTLLNILGELLGDYAQQTDTDALMVKQAGGINNDVARLRAARFVSAVETEEGKRLAEVKIKQFTGGDTVTARFLFQEFFEFKPLFKLFIATNHKPEIKGTDNAIWRRVRLVPFDVTFTPEQQDRTLADKLRAELPGILAWAVQGCFKWQRDGLGLPDEVKAATKAYREEQDLVALFLTDCCVIEQHAQVTAKNLNAAYQEWCKASGEKSITAIELGKRLTERGLTAKKGTGGVRKWIGIGLQCDTQTSLLSDTNSGASEIVAHSGAENDLIEQNSVLRVEPENRATMRHSGQNAPLSPATAATEVEEK